MAKLSLLLLDLVDSGRKTPLGKEVGLRTPDDALPFLEQRLAWFGKQKDSN
jgi:hypothetical protein